MQINVTGRHLDIGDAFRSHITERLDAAASKFFDRAIDASVRVEKNGHTFTIHCSLHPIPGLELQSSAAADEVYAAFDLAAEKLEKQLRRHKRRIKNHHHSGSKPELSAMDAALDTTGAPTE